MKNEKTGILLIAILSICALIGIFITGPIAQNTDYHDFSDSVSYLSIPNTLNVLSNLPFLVVSCIGLMALRATGENSLKIADSDRLSYLFLYLGVGLISIGSAYYHLNPSNDTLVWDRIPMTMAFMAFYSLIISEFVSEKLGAKCLIPFTVAGIFSVLYWWYTESHGVGDLRYYLVVQFLPILTIPIMLTFFKSKYNHVRGYWLLLASYIAAKIVELLDHQIHSYLSVISGHSIKHVLPAIGLYLLIRSYRKRSITTPDS